MNIQRVHLSAMGTHVGVNSCEFDLSKSATAGSKGRHTLNILEEPARSACSKVCWSELTRAADGHLFPYSHKHWVLLLFELLYFLDNSEVGHLFVFINHCPFLWILYLYFLPTFPFRCLSWALFGHYVWKSIHWESEGERKRQCSEAPRRGWKSESDCSRHQASVCLVRNINPLSAESWKYFALACRLFLSLVCTNLSSCRSSEHSSVQGLLLGFLSCLSGLFIFSLCKLFPGFSGSIFYSFIL